MGIRPKFNNPDDMQAGIYQYFEDCRKNREADDKGWGELKDLVTEDRYPNVTGLGLVLDLTREGLINYEQKDEFADTVKRAKQRIESFTVQRLFMNNPTGSIFNLKNNFGWKDKTEVESSGVVQNKIVMEIVDAKDQKEPKNVTPE